MGIEVAQILSLLVSFVLAYVVALKPLVRWIRTKKPWQLANGVRSKFVVRSKFRNSREKSVKEAGVGNTIVFKTAAIAIALMFLYMPANELIGSSQTGFEYRFIWEMGSGVGVDRYYRYIPNVPVLIAQLLGVAAIAGFWAVSNRK